MLFVARRFEVTHAMFKYLLVVLIVAGFASANSGASLIVAREFEEERQFLVKDVATNVSYKLFNVGDL